ncbi:MAG: glycosyl transferase, partial [Betaproteobacteria bacterium]|nr:glycosyl transferase [Betaproteobacteria bacterium]
MALVPAMLVGWAFSTHYPWIAAVSTLVLAVASYFDDRQGLPVAFRLAMHISVAVVFVLVRADEVTLVVIIVLVLSIAWSINLYNFMDGADGLAGGMALFGFGAYAVAAWLQGATDFASLNMCVASAALGFLIFNFPPARTFLGDAGSVPLGFLAAVFGIVGTSSMLWPWW